MKFEKTNMKQVRGVQASVYDALLPHFENEGDCLEFDEKIISQFDPKITNPDGLTRPAAAQAAKRLSLLSGKKFHSFYNTLKKKVTIRLRVEGEVLDKSDEDSSDSEPQPTEGNFSLD